MPKPEEFNPLSPETIENPYGFYRSMRENAPVYLVPGAGFYIVSRYEDAMSVLENEELFSSRQPPGLLTHPTRELEEIQRSGYPTVDTLLTNDPPAHTRYRVLVNKAFSARRVASMETSVRNLANTLVDEFISDGRVELVSQFAVPLPLSVIADALGVDRKDTDSFKRWSDDSIAPLGGMISYERRLECARSIVEFQHYFAGRLEERRREPHDDILTDLIQARLDGAEPLNTAEMLSILQQLLVAGNETTTNLIASAMMILLKNRQQMKTLIENQELIPKMIEEALRFESPVQGLGRIATKDTELGGVPIPAGALLMVMYGSANRDQHQFPDAETFKVGRENARTHLAFGQGIHFCLGAALARLEGRVAFETMLTRLKNIRIAP